MKRFLILALLLTQCTTITPSEEIKPTSIDVEDFNEQILSLEGLPFNIVLPSDWKLESTSFQHQLWKNEELQLVFERESTVTKIPEQAEVIPSVDTMDITSFCTGQSCVIQKDGAPLIEAQVFTPEGKEALERLR